MSDLAESDLSWLQELLSPWSGLMALSDRLLETGADLTQKIGSGLAAQATVAAAKAGLHHFLGTPELVRAAIEKSFKKAIADFRAGFVGCTLLASRDRKRDSRTFDERTLVPFFTANGIVEAARPAFREAAAKTCEWLAREKESVLNLSRLDARPDLKVYALPLLALLLLAMAWSRALPGGSPRRGVGAAIGRPDPLSVGLPETVRGDGLLVEQHEARCAQRQLPSAGQVSPFAAL